MLRLCNDSRQAVEHLLLLGIGLAPTEEFGKQVPPDEVGSILIKEEVAEELAKIKKEYLVKAKEEELLSKVNSEAVKTKRTKSLQWPCPLPTGLMSKNQCGKIPR